MPQIIPFIPLLAAGITGGTQLGLTLSGAGQPSTSDPNKALADQQSKQATADAEAKKKAIFANLANSQEQTGGNVNSPGLVDLAAIISGLPGEATSGAGKGALASFLGTGTPTLPQDNLVGATFGLNGGQG